MGFPVLQPFSQVGHLHSLGEPMRPNALLLSSLLAALLALAAASSAAAGEVPQHPNPFKNLPQHVLDELAAGGEVTIDHTYEHGVRTTSKYRGANWYLLDRTVDRSGVVLSERGAAGLEIAYEYDQLHRVTAVKPSAAHGGAWVQIRHSIVSTGPKMELFYRQNGSMTATPMAFYLPAGEAAVVVVFSTTSQPSRFWRRT
ncbi:MAG: hypothetical protein AAF772_03210 [Acidobacteriota bacterium]